MMIILKWSVFCIVLVIIFELLIKNVMHVNMYDYFWLFMVLEARHKHVCSLCCCL